MLIRRSGRVLTRNGIHRGVFGRFMYRTYSSTNPSHYSTASQLNNNRTHRTQKSNRDISLAFLGGSGLLVLSYSYFSQNPIVLDSINGIRDYSNKSTNNGNSITLLTENEINNKLHDLEQSYFINRNKGIIRYDVSQLPSNNPIEDNHIEQIITVPSQNSDNEGDDLYFFGIFDGHSGPFTSSKLAKDLVRYVAKQLSPFFTPSSSSTSDDSVKFDSAISSAFLQLDNDIIQNSFRQLFKEPIQQNMINVLPAISGSCALLSLYKSEDSTLKVAVTGDSRALIGGIDENNNWFVKSLSIDQTGDNIDEVKRIQNEHPGEPNAVRRGRVLGCLQPSRAFGDYRYKLNEVDGKKLSELPDHVKIYFRSEPRDLLTPPYVTAEPEITTTKITDNIKFMVLGSDGLFELLTNEEIVGLVVKWKEYYMAQDEKVRQYPAHLGQLPQVKDITDDKSAQRPAFRYKKKQNNNTANYLLEDTNVSTHLIRNALSAGGQKEYVSTLVSIPSPMSRKYRDDLTVTVAFFGDTTNNDGSIEINQESTTGPKPKL